MTFETSPQLQPVSWNYRQIGFALRNNASHVLENHILCFLVFLSNEGTIILLMATGLESRPRLAIQLKVPSFLLRLVVPLRASPRHRARLPFSSKEQFVCSSATSSLVIAR